MPSEHVLIADASRQATAPMHVKLENGFQKNTMISHPLTGGSTLLSASYARPPLPLVSTAGPSHGTLHHLSIQPVVIVKNAL